MPARAAFRQLGSTSTSLTYAVESANVRSVATKAQEAERITLTHNGIEFMALSDA